MVLRVPWELAILDGDAARDVLAAYPEVRRWIVGGHSLGGVAAAGFVEGEPSVEGLLLWASYPSRGTDLSDRNLEVSSVWGTEDGLVNRESLAEADARLPASTTRVQIEGANHAQFGDYGAQRGHGQSKFSNQEARETIVDASASLIQRLRRNAE